MAIKTQKQNYSLGRGQLLFARFLDDTQVPGGFRYVGNTPEFNLTIESEELQHFSSDGGIREEDDSVPLDVTRSGTFTTDSVKPENISYFFFGEESLESIVGASVVDELIENVALGSTYQLGLTEDDPLGNRMISNVVVNGDESVAASKALTFSGPGTEDDTVTIDAVVYRLRDSGNLAQANDVLIGGSASETAYNLGQAINAGAGEGVLYYTGTAEHASVSAAVAAAVVTVTAKVAGAAGNSIAISESGTNTSWAGAATALSGGSDESGAITAAGNYTLDTDNGLLTIEVDAADIAEGDDLEVSYDYATTTRQRIISGSEPVEGAMIFIANNPKGHDFNYYLPWVKLSPNGDYALKGDDWQTIPFNLRVLKRTDQAAITVDGKPYVY